MANITKIGFMHKKMTVFISIPFLNFDQISLELYFMFNYNILLQNI